MSIISGYTQPQTGSIDFIFGGGLVAFATALVALLGWGVLRLFAFVAPKTFMKENTEMKGKVVNDRKK